MWNDNNKKGGEEEEETDNQNIAALFVCMHTPKSKSQLCNAYERARFD